MNEMEVFDPISEALGTETPMVALPRPEQTEATAAEDFNTARANLRELIQQGMAAVPTMMMLMREAQSDKMFSSGAAYMKMLADLNAQLLKQSKENIKSAPPAVAQAQNVNITQTNHVYHGTTTDYLRQRKARKLEEAEDVIEGELVER